MIHIHDINDLRIAAYRSLRENSGNCAGVRTFIAEGEKVALRALQSGLPIESLFALQEYYSRYRELIEAAVPDPDSRFVSSNELMTKIVGFSMHQGMLASVRRPARVVLTSLSTPIVALNGINDSENVGLIVRNCAAFGIPSLIVDRRTASPWLRRAVRVSMGAVMSMQVHLCEHLDEALATLQRERRLTVYSSELKQNSVDLHQVQFNPKSIIVFGSEGYGIQDEVLALSDTVVRIPISTKVHSLNVAAASAIVLHHFYSQRE